MPTYFVLTRVVINQGFDRDSTARYLMLDEEFHSNACCGSTYVRADDLAFNLCNESCEWIIKRIHNFIDDLPSFVSK